MFKSCKHSNAIIVLLLIFQINICSSLRKTSFNKNQVMLKSTSLSKEAESMNEIDNLLLNLSKPEAKVDILDIKDNESGKVLKRLRKLFKKDKNVNQNLKTLLKHIILNNVGEEFCLLERVKYNVLSADVEVIESFAPSCTRDYIANRIRKDISELLQSKLNDKDKKNKPKVK